MENNYDDDNLERFFNKRLSTYEEKPPTGLWQDIADQIDSKEASHLPYWWWMILPLLLLGYISTWYLYQQNTELKNKQIQQQENIQELDKKYNQLLAQQTAKTTELTQLISQLSDNNAQKVIYNTKYIPQSTTTYSSTITPGQLMILYGQHRIANYGQFASFNKQQTTLLDNKNNIYINRHGIYPLPRGVIVIQQPTAQPPHLPLQTEKNKSYKQKKNKESKQFFVGVKVDAALAGLGNYYAENDAIFGTSAEADQLVLQSDQLLSRLNYSVISGIKLNKRWELGLGLCYGSETGYSYDKRVFSYTEDGSIPTLGGTLNTYEGFNQNKENGYSYEILNDIQNDGEDIGEGELFFVNSHSKYRKSYYRVPIYSRLYIGKKRLRTFVQGGMSWNLLTTKHLDLKNVSTSFNRLSVIDYDYDGIINGYSYLSTDFALGLSYKLTPKVAIFTDIGGSLPLTFSSIRPQREVFPRVLWSGFGIQYYFGRL